MRAWCERVSAYSFSNRRPRVTGRLRRSLLSQEKRNGRASEMATQIIYMGTPYK
jgi:hypothetical protein